MQKQVQIWFVVLVSSVGSALHLRAMQMDPAKDSWSEPGRVSPIDKRLGALGIFVYSMERRGRLDQSQVDYLMLHLGQISQQAPEIPQIKEVVSPGLSAFDPEEESLLQYLKRCLPNGGS